ncbi:MAG: flippase [Microgenomates group bacterium]
MERKIIKNTFFLGSANFLARVIGFFYFIFLGRVLGVENFGHYNFAIALVYNFYPVADFGVERLILRDLSKDTSKAQEYFQKIIPLRVVLAIISIILVSLLGFFLSKNNFDRLNVFIFSLCLLPWTFNQLVAGIANAFERMEIQALAIVLMSSLVAFLGGVTAGFKGNVTLVLFSAFLGNLIVSLIMYNLAKKIGLKFKIDKDFVFWRKIIKESVVFASITIIAVFYLRMGVVMINWFKGAYWTGIYSSSFKFLEASLLLPQSFALALFPQTARLLKANKVHHKIKLKENYLKSLSLIFVFSLIYGLIFWFFSSLIIKFSYGSSYLEGEKVMKFLGIVAGLFFLNSLPGNIIQNTAEIKKFVWWLGGKLILHFLLCLYFIPRLGLMGAVLSLGISEFYGLLVNNWFVFKILKAKS